MEYALRLPDYKATFPPYFPPLFFSFSYATIRQSGSCNTLTVPTPIPPRPFSPSSLPSLSFLAFSLDTPLPSFSLSLPGCE